MAIAKVLVGICLLIQLNYKIKLKDICDANNSTVGLFKIRKIADEDLGRFLDKIWMLQENRYYRNNLERCVNKMNDPNKKDGN